MSNTTAKADNRFEWFAGANSKNGFVGIFDQIFAPDAFDRIYIITGAPGTGKSKLMRSVAEAVGEAEAELIFCSSDPSSLDGVILRKNNRRIGILDGTAPHGRLPSFPGSVETVVDLGRFWNKEALSRQRDRIRQLSFEKRAAYEDAYAALAIVGKAREERLRLLERAFLRKKAEAVLRRLCKRIAPVKGAAATRYRSAIGLNGACTLKPPTDVECALYRLPVFYGAELLCLSLLCDLLHAGEAEYIRCPTVIDPLLTEMVLLPKNNICFCVSEATCEGASDIVLNPKRFIDADAFRLIRRRVRSLEAIEDEEVKAATRSLAVAGKKHFELETLFCQEMDFSAKEAYTDALIREIRKELALPC